MLSPGNTFEGHRKQAGAEAGLKWGAGGVESERGVAWGWGRPWELLGPRALRPPVTGSRAPLGGRYPGWDSLLQLQGRPQAEAESELRCQHPPVPTAVTRRLQGREPPLLRPPHSEAMPVLQPNAHQAPRGAGQGSGHGGDGAPEQTAPGDAVLRTPGWTRSAAGMAQVTCHPRGPHPGAADPAGWSWSVSFRDRFPGGKSQKEKGNQASESSCIEHRESQMEQGVLGL